MNCSNKCCDIKYKTYERRPNKIHNKYNRIKAGMVLYNKAKNKVLMVQSCGNLWGFPKGTIKFNECIKDCAVRELFEETGLSLDNLDEAVCISINNRAYYFVCEDDMSREIAAIDKNDVNAVGWISLGCLADLISSGRISINSHCKIILGYFSCNKI